MEPVDFKTIARQSKTRLLEIEDDLDQTETLFNKSNSRAYRAAINKLRYLLIVEMHNLQGYRK